MKFNIIDKSKWERIEYYEHFTKNIPCTFSITNNIDITNILPVLKNKNIKFYPFMIYSITKIVNSYENFRISIEDNNLGFFDYLNPSYTILNNNNKLFSTIWTKYNNDFKIFYNNYLKDLNNFSNTNKLIIKKPINNTFNISCIPWVSFTSFNLNLQNNYNYFLPIFTIGKYFNDREKILLPLNAQVHHAVCDGYHISLFFNDLQQFIYNFNNSKFKAVD
nr:type A chloramphenicol O-acetyltransferase [uncultured Tyzzerella sp.]